MEIISAQPQDPIVTPITNGDKRNPDGTFAPGYKGGPGRPRVSITEEIKKALNEDFIVPASEKSPEERRTALQFIIDRILKNAIIKEDEKTLAKIWAYIDGLPKGSLDLGVDREGLAELTEFMKAMANPSKNK